ncbi:ComEA family DNA-binding protein [Corallincola platygyrae]|uniref:ComEA family DNA-binding protein n=1 Tax=Corallincola platygyrae TaxID=1193278 RepID=A0ABW4XR90_9GAMM
MTKSHLHTFAAAILIVASFGFGATANATNSEQADIVNPAQASQTIQINEASAEEIAEVLDGIGLKKAEAIVEYREQHGPFSSLSMLENVKGIGSKTIAANSDKIAFDIPTLQ